MGLTIGLELEDSLDRSKKNDSPGRRLAVQLSIRGPDARRRATLRDAPGAGDRAEIARLRFAALPRRASADRRQRRRLGRQGLGPALREPGERGAARDAAAPELVR